MNIELPTLTAQLSYLINRELVYPTNKTVIKIIDVNQPEGPVYFKRKAINSNKSWKDTKIETISSNMLWRVIKPLSSGKPVQIDRVLGASYNSRSALEAMIAHTPNFFLCHPKRITEINSKQVIFEKVHKHLIFKETGHAAGKIEYCNYNGFIAEAQSEELYIEATNINSDKDEANKIKDPSIKRIHSQMQVWLSDVAKWLKLRPWIAVQDHGISINGQNLLNTPGMVTNLFNEPAISNYQQAVTIAKNIDCIWFNGGIPCAFEVEHTTGITPGLDRMGKLQSILPFIKTDYVIVAPDQDRQEVFKKASYSQFNNMDLWYLPYSSLSEMCLFTKKHQNRLDFNQHQNFLRTFMEPIPKSVGK